MKLNALAPFLILFLCASVSFAQDDSLTQITDSAEYEKILNALQEFHADVATLTAQFTQLKVIVPFNDTEESSGSVVLKKPGRFMWEFTEPELQKVIIKETRGYIFNDALKQTQIFPVEDNNFLNFLLAGLTKPLGEYFVDFNVTFFRGIQNGQQVYHYQMNPNKEEIKNYIKLCEVSFAQDTLLPIFARLTESSGDVTVITFSDVSINEAIDDEQFSTVIPPDYEVLDYRQ